MHSDEAKIYSAILVAASVLATILVFFIISLLRQRKKTDQLHFEKINAEITTLENERKRVARDLHDEIAMMLSVAKLELSCMDIQDVDNRELLLKACTHIDSSLVKIREIMKDLMPTALTRKGLRAALYEFFDTINETNAMRIEYCIDDMDKSIPDTISVHLFRVIQEIVYNALKHSQASKVIVTFKVETECLHILIRDDGKGFDEQTVTRQNSGLGLHSIVSRIELLHGSIYLDTGVNKGVSYTIDIPLTTKL